jgi:hypothetical protein
MTAYDPDDVPVWTNDDPPFAGPERDAYVAGIVAALRAGRVPGDAITDTCPECGDTPQRTTGGRCTDGHVVALAPEGRYGADHGLAVLVGCEGYFVIDPTHAGVPIGGWEDWRRGYDR